MQRPWPRPPVRSAGCVERSAAGPSSRRRRGSSSTSATARSRRSCDACSPRGRCASGGASSCSATTTSPRWRLRPLRELGSAGTVAGLAVVDVDPAVLAFARTARGRALPDRVRRARPPRATAGVAPSAFDTVLTDPPYTLPAARFSPAPPRPSPVPTATSSSASARGGRTRRTCCSGRSGSRLRDPAARARLQPVRGGGVLGGTSHLYHLTATRDARVPSSAVRRAALHLGGLTAPATARGRRLACGAHGLERVGTRRRGRAVALRGRLRGSRRSSSSSRRARASSTSTRGTATSSRRSRSGRSSWRRSRRSCTGGASARLPPDGPKPERHFESFARAGADSVTFHVEAVDPPRATAAARASGSARASSSSPPRRSRTRSRPRRAPISSSACRSSRATRARTSCRRRSTGSPGSARCSRATCGCRSTAGSTRRLPARSRRGRRPPGRGQRGLLARRPGGRVPGARRCRLSC